LTTACSVGVVRFGVFFAQFTTTNGGPVGVTLCAATTALHITISSTSIAWWRDLDELEEFSKLHWEPKDFMRAMLGMA
jgi:hypothetical protein